MELTIKEFHVGPFKVCIETDSDANNPCEEQDGLGFIHSFSTRHGNYLDPDKAFEMKEADPDVVPLSYFEHGQCMWMIADGPTPAGVEFQFDGRRYAGIWVPDDCIRESYRGQDGKSRAEWMRDQADRCCEIYTAWCNGDIYQYTIEDEDGDVVESLCGTYYLDHCTAEAKSAAKRLLADRESEARKIAAMMHE